MGSRSGMGSMMGSIRGSMRASLLLMLATTTGARCIASTSRINAMGTYQRLRARRTPLFGIRDRSIETRSSLESEGNQSEKSVQPEGVIEHLEDGSFNGKSVRDMYTPERLERLKTLVANRQKGIIVVLENIYSYENAAAVIRSCDAFGVSDVWFIRRKTDKLEKALQTDTFQTISSGASRWINTRIFQSTAECAEELKKEGYISVATCLTESSVNIFKTDMTVPKVALWLGNEGKGLTEEAMELADICSMLPMKGMVQSLNLSTAAAIFLAEIMRQRGASVEKGLAAPESFNFQESEQEVMLDQMLMNDILRRNKQSVQPVAKKAHWEKRVNMR